MSGHSHFATIKRQKAANDAVRGNLFSKLARSIMLAAKAGANPDMNFKLRVEIDKARSMGLPKENIERAIGRATSGAENLDEITYEGFGPNGLLVMVEVATDNKNRTAQEIKNLFEKHGGRMGGPGAVAYNFDHKGYLLIKNNGSADEMMLKLIDLGIDDISSSEEGIDVYVAPEDLSRIREKVLEQGFEILKTEMCMKPKNPLVLTDEAELEKAISFLDVFEEHDDVSNVYSNLS